MADMEVYAKIRHLNREYRKAQMVLRDELERQLIAKLAKFEEARDEAIWAAWSRDANKSAIGRAIESRDWATTNGIITRLQESGKYNTAVVTEEGEIGQPDFDLHVNDDGDRVVGIGWQGEYAEFSIEFWRDEFQDIDMVLVINLEADDVLAEMARLDCAFRKDWATLGELGKALKAFMDENYQEEIE